MCCGEILSPSTNCSFYWEKQKETLRSLMCTSKKSYFIAELLKVLLCGSDLCNKVYKKRNNAMLKLNKFCKIILFRLCADGDRCSRKLNQCWEILNSGRVTTTTPTYSREEKKRWWTRGRSRWGRLTDVFWGWSPSECAFFPPPFSIQRTAFQH